MNTSTFFRTILFLGLSLTFIYGCNQKTTPIVPEEGDYQLVSKYDSIRTYPNGGGIFVLKLIPNDEFTGKVNLQVSSDSKLNPVISKSILAKSDSIFDICINPSQNLNPGVYSIHLITEHAGKQKNKDLLVQVYEWGDNSGDAQLKLDQFRSWIEQNKPKYKNIFTSQKKIYSTYPQTLIVEHYTFLFEEYEVRLCYHVMIPPYDWSKLCVRNRLKMSPELVLIRETDGIIHEIQEADYPYMYGY